jgi:hypothetical protein
MAPEPSHLSASMLPQSLIGLHIAVCTSRVATRRGAGLKTHSAQTLVRIVSVFETVYTVYTV